MFKLKGLIMAAATVFIVSIVINGASLYAEEDPGSISKKVRKIRRLMKRGLNPYRVRMGLMKTGQTISYTAGDDGDLGRGIAWPEPRFIDHGNGTVTDKVSGLMWAKNAQEIPLKMTWHEAITTCNDIIFAGFDDWRLSNIREILSLIDYGTTDPALPHGHPFINVSPAQSYWSSTTSSADSAQAWHVEIQHGNIRPHDKAKNIHHVWPVRRGRQHIW
jgi:hypothetical protein